MPIRPYDNATPIVEVSVGSVRSPERMVFRVVGVNHEEVPLSRTQRRTGGHHPCCRSSYSKAFFQPATMTKAFLRPMGWASSPRSSLR